MPSSVWSSKAPLVTFPMKNGRAALRWTDEDICPYVRCSRYLFSASRLWGMAMPCFCRLSGDRTDYLGGFARNGFEAGRRDELAGKFGRGAGTAVGGVHDAAGCLAA